MKLLFLSMKQKLTNMQKLRLSDLVNGDNMGVIDVINILEEKEDFDINGRENKQFEPIRIYSEK